jgi:ribosomal protein S18 acetylase RimI-like enzyme
MRVRAVTEADASAIRALWEAFEAEVPEPPGFTPETWEEAWADLRRHAAEGVALIAEDDEGPAGYAFATALRGARSHVTDVYVRPDARRRGVASELVRQLAAGMRDLGAEWVSLDVQTKNRGARAFWERLGFADVQAVLATRLDVLDERAGGEGAASADASVGVVHVQTDDQAAVVAAVERFVPRLYRSAATVVSPPRNGWVAVHDEAGERQPELLRRLAEELSNVTGSVLVALAVESGRFVRLAAFERGSLLDEYLSVPDAYGPIAPGDAVALRANATVLSRLTGAEPARIREVARTAVSPGELPPAPELAEALAATLGLAPPRALAEAAAEPGAVVVEH